MLCEMCGKEVESLSRVRVEGSVLSLCADCSRFGVVLEAPPAPKALAAPAPRSSSGIPSGVGVRSRRMEERDLYKELPDMDMAPDWPKRIRVAREKLGWKPEDLAKKLNEKKSIILKIESGHFRPPDGMVPRIENLLKIRLRADPEPSP